MWHRVTIGIIYTPSESMIVGLASDILCKIAGCLLLDEQKNELSEWPFPWANGWGLSTSSIDLFTFLLVWYGIIHIHPQKQTWNLKMDPWKRRFLLETIISRFHVCFRGCTLSTTLKILQRLTWENRIGLSSEPLKAKLTHSKLVGFGDVGFFKGRLLKRPNLCHQQVTWMTVLVWWTFYGWRRDPWDEHSRWSQAPFTGRICWELFSRHQTEAAQVYVCFRPGSGTICKKHLYVFPPTPL